MAPGQTPPRLRSRQEYLEAMTALVRDESVDIMLTSASNGEQLARDRVLEGSPVTPVVRANDATDIWNQRGGGYPQRPSRPFRSADLQSVSAFCDLVLYSITFNNDRDLDLATLEAYARFRADARAAGLRHILEVFNPNAPVGLSGQDVGAFINDSIVRTLAGLTGTERPLFLKVAFNGPDELEELVNYDPRSCRRCSWRGCGDDARHLRAVVAGGAAWCPSCPVRTKDPAGGVAERPGWVSCGQCCAGT